MRRLCSILLLALGACSTWRPVAQYPQWTLYEAPDRDASESEFSAAFEPAIRAVEELLGPFEKRVAVHALGEDTQTGHRLGTGIHDVPGIGPARIQAFHARGGGALGRDGIFMRQPDAGTAVHELVHARLAEEDEELPLWFEEGLACVLGDGMLIDGEWVVDGLSCWPLRELSEEDIGPQQFLDLLAVDATDHTDVRDNVLVHFVGWAIVFDYFLESDGRFEWRRWLADTRQASAPELRGRMERTLATATGRWIQRLNSPHHEVRMVTAKGLWKLRDRQVLDLMLERLRVEEDREAKTAIALNTLAAAGELPLAWGRWQEIEGAVREALRDNGLIDPAERRAAFELYRLYGNGGNPNKARLFLDELRRLWDE